MKDFVIYTAMTGGYDNILQPRVIDERFDYVLFSNDIVDKYVGTWEVRPIPQVFNNDNKRMSRYPKTHPETMLAEYKASLYIDANIQILDEWVYERCVELYKLKIEHAGIELVMTGRDCIYDHAYDMCLNLLEHDYVAIKQCQALYNEGFPRHFGLNENNIIFRTHTKKMKEVDEEWWSWIVNYSGRDQFSYMYCLWKYKVPLNYFLPEGEDARNGSHFLLINHDGDKNVIKVKVIKRSIIEKFRIKAKSFNREKYLEKWHSFYVSPCPLLYLYVDGIFTILKNVPNFISMVMGRNQEV